jgi:hypothetical protein
MAEQVKGTIGQEQVFLENAATEATLLKLIEAVKAQGGSASKVSGTAAAAGVSPQTIAAATEATNQNTKAQVSGREVAKNLFDQFASGNATVGGVFAALSMLPGNIGLVAQVFAKVVEIQEANFVALQKTASAGVTFGGALTQVRIAASDAYLTLDQFGDTVAKNADVFAGMGGNAEDGVKQFVKIQNTLLAPGSETQRNLATLGYSMADAAQLTADFMRGQGSMNKEGLKDTKAVSQAVSAYAQELTLLSEVTGKSREEIQAQMNKENMESQWKNLLAGLSPEEARKAQMGLANASTQGQGAIDYFKAKMMGFPPLTEQGQLFAATQQAGTAALDSYVKTAKDASISTEDAAKKNREALAKSIAQGAGDMNKMRSVLQASGLTGSALSKTLADAQNLQTKYMKDGKMMSEAEIVASMEKQAQDLKNAESEAANLKESEAEMKKFYAALVNAVAPILTGLTFAIKLVMNALGLVLNPIVWLGKTLIDIIAFSLTPLKIAFDSVVTGFSELWSKLMSTLEPVIAPFRKLFEGGSGAVGKFFGMMQDFAGFLIAMPFRVLFGALGFGLDLVAGAFEILGSVIELVLTPLQMMATGLSSLFDAVTDTAKKLNPLSWFSSDEKKPKMAAGGIVTQATSLIAGEAGAEAIIPLAQLDGIIKNALGDSIVNGMSQMQTSNMFAGVGDLISQTIGMKTASTAGTTETSSALSNTPGNNNSETLDLLTAKLDLLNNTTRELIGYMRDTANNTKKTHEATRALNGDLFAAT